MSSVGPTVVIIILSYLVSTIFIQVFVIAVDTTMLCYCEDLKKNGLLSQCNKCRRPNRLRRKCRTSVSWSIVFSSISSPCQKIVLSC